MEVASYDTWAAWNASILSPLPCNQQGYNMFVRTVTEANSIAPGYIEVSASEAALKTASANPVEAIRASMSWIATLPDNQATNLVAFLTGFAR
jgi:hypothetical protein